MNIRTSQRTVKLVVGGVMIALATVLSLIKVFELPYGGSITLFSMLPIAFFGYRYGAKWGLFIGLIHGCIQMLLGSGGLRGMGLGSLVGVIVFDYLLAFALLGFAGMFRNKVKNPAWSFALGAVAAGFLRLVSHIFAGFLFWGEYAEWYFSNEGFTFGAWVLEHVSGSALALIYSVVYNASYMLPEIVITAVGAFLLIKLAGRQILDKTELSASAVK